MSFIKLSITIDPNHADHLSDSLIELGALSVSLKDAGDEPIFQLEPGDSPLWQQTKLDALFDNNVEIETIIKALKTENTDITNLNFHAEKIEDQDWVRLTQQQFQPKQFGNKLWVCPAWENTEVLEGTIVKIDPGLAFGTGTHPTTSLCLNWLASNPPKNKIVMDYGCGSGILSLAALALGAKHVIAIDHDQQALIATKNNAELNSFYHPDQLSILLPDDTTPYKRADLIIANILSKPLIELAPKLIESLTVNGILVLSGLLEKEIQTVTAAYEKSLSLKDKIILDDWACLIFSAAS